MKKNNGWASFWRRKQYIIAGTFVAAAVVGMTALYSNRQEQERKNAEQEIAAEMSTEESVQAEKASSVILPKETEQTESVAETETQAAEVAKEEETEQPVEDNAENKETAPASGVTETLHFAAEDGLLWPMEGNVILDYSMEATVYFATLDQYKYNPAVVIAGDVNSKVYAVAKGKVESIANDEVTGCTVTVSLGDGYEAVYGQLKDLNFAEGDYVEAGHVLGYVSEPTKYFSVEGSNLYFELRKDGAPIDPIEFFE